MANTTRERLLAAAWSILRDQGITAATSRRITEAADANLAAITYHFGSKDELLGTVIVDQLRAWSAPLSAALTAETPDVASHDAQVMAAVTGILARLTSQPEEVRLIVNLLLTGTDIPGVRDAAITWLGELRAVASDVMTRQQAAGHIPTNVNPQVMAAVFTAFALGAGAQATLDPSAPPGALVVTEFLALLVRPAPGP